MAMESQGAPGLDYDAFRKKVDAEAFTGQQMAPLKLRLDLLESFMDRPSKTREGQQAPAFPDTKAGRQARTKWFVQEARERSEKQTAESAWDFKPGTLTIVDLSCPFVDESSACALFSICLDLFLESRNNTSRIIAHSQSAPTIHLLRLLETQGCPMPSAQWLANGQRAAEALLVHQRNPSVHNPY